MTSHWYCCTLVVLAFGLFSTGQLVNQDEKDWIDPGDMLNYDLGSQKMINKKTPQNQEVEEKTCTCEDQISASREKYQSAMTQLDICLKEKESIIETETESVCDTTTGKEGTFFRQYVGSLLWNFGSQGGSYQLQLTLSEEDLEILKRFSRLGTGRVEDAHEVLTNMVDHVKALDHPYTLTLRDKLENYLGIDLTSLFKIVAMVMMGSMTFSMLVRIHVPWPQIVLKLMLVLFFMSIPWNWWHMYKVAVARRHAELLKDVPPECTPSNQSAGQTIYQWFASSFSFTSDECAKYHEKLLVDPVWEVPPTQALAVTLTKFFLEPLRHIGVALSQLVRGLLEDMPLHLWPVVLILFIVLTFFILILACGYKVNIFHVFGLEPARMHHTSAPRIEAHQPQVQAIGDRPHGGQAQQGQLPQPENIPDRNYPVHDVPDNGAVQPVDEPPPRPTVPLPTVGGAGDTVSAGQAEWGGHTLGQGQVRHTEQAAGIPNTQTERPTEERPSLPGQTQAEESSAVDDGAMGVQESQTTPNESVPLGTEDEVRVEGDGTQHPRPPISESEAANDGSQGTVDQRRDRSLELRPPIEEVGVQQDSLNRQDGT